MPNAECRFESKTFTKSTSRGSKLAPLNSVKKTMGHSVLRPCPEYFLNGKQLPSLSQGLRTACSIPFLAEIRMLFWGQTLVHMKYQCYEIILKQ